MPHFIREEHLDDICAGCKQNPGKEITLTRHHHRVYELITCMHCGYENIKSKIEYPFTENQKFRKGNS
ncbi:MAG TPA: hypothetical protein VEC16_06580 [Alphaproteobacteria bacterium]|nr:hypothetical protein [Alphaproteobacteria bacterium]